MDFWYGWIKFVLGSYLRVLGIRAEVSGLEHIPDGPKILVANHPNATDSFHIPFLIREKIIALVESDVMQRKVVGRWLQLADQIPVVAGRGKEALQAAQEHLSRGEAILIYPEAKLTSTHQVTRAGTGVARLALAADVPIVPLGFYVRERDLRVFRGHTKEGRATAGAWQVKGKTYIKFGPPMSVAHNSDGEENYQLYRRLTDDLMRNVTALAEGARQLAKGGD